MEMTNPPSRTKHIAGTVQSMGLPDDDTHTRRLQAAAMMLNRYRTASLLDVGCGLGDLRLRVNCERYLGIDEDEAAIEDARYRLPVTQFRVIALKDLVPANDRFDAVAALSLLNRTPPAHLRVTLNRLGRHSNRLLCVSFLTRDEPPETGLYSHSFKLVSAGRRVIEDGETDGETTLLIDLRR